MARRKRELIEEALEADREIEAGAPVYAAEDVHAWLKRLARGGKSTWPRPWRSSVRNQ